MSEGNYLDCVHWYWKTHLNCDQDYFLGKGPGLYKKEKASQAWCKLSLLSSNWIHVTSCFKPLDFPHPGGHTLNTELKLSPFSRKLLLPEYFILATRKNTKMQASSQSFGAKGTKAAACSELSRLFPPSHAWRKFVPGSSLQAAVESGEQPLWEKENSAKTASRGRVVLLTALSRWRAHAFILGP